MTIDDARKCWPEKFLWLHPNLGSHNSDSIKNIGKFVNWKTE